MEIVKMQFDSDTHTHTQTHTHPRMLQLSFKDQKNWELNQTESRM